MILTIFFPKILLLPPLTMQGMEVLSNESTPTATAKGSDDYIPSLLEVAKVVNIEMEFKTKKESNASQPYLCEKETA